MHNSSNHFEFLFRTTFNFSYQVFDLHAQQSALSAQLLPGVEKSPLQLLLPQVRVPAHSESLSQSPPPRLHGCPLVQHEKSVLGTPSHALAGGRVVVETDAKV